MNIKQQDLTASRNLCLSHHARLLDLWSGNFFLIVPFSDHCLLVPFHSSHHTNHLKSIFSGCLADICLEYNLNPYGYDTDGKYLVCPGGCCGTRYAKYCCDETRWYYNAGTVAGLVVGYLFVIITLIVVLVCCYRKRPGAQGRVTVAMSRRTPPTRTVQDNIYPEAPPSYTESVTNEQPAQGVS